MLISAAILAILALCMMASSPNAPNQRDASLKLSLALPASTTAVTTATALDLGKMSQLGLRPANFELLVTAPALSLARLPDGKTMTYALIMSDNADLSSPSYVYVSALIVQTGVTGTDPQPAQTKRVRLPSDANQYVGLIITPSTSGTGDASGISATVEVCF